MSIKIYPPTQKTTDVSLWMNTLFLLRRIPLCRRNIRYHGCKAVELHMLILALLFFTVTGVYAGDVEEDALHQGITYYNKGMYDSAISEFGVAIKNNPGNGEAFYRRGLAYYKTGDCDLAVYNYNKAIQYHVKSAEVYYNRGLAFSRKKEYEQAMLDFNKALELKPDFAYVYEERANIYFYNKEYDKAWQDVHQIEALGFRVNPGFLRQLKQVSQREK